MEEIKTKENGAARRSLQIVVFKLGGEEYGLQIDQIKEVVLTPRITQMPQTPPYVRGVANIRGNVIAIFDLEERFALRKSEHSTPGKYTLVIESDEFKVGLLVNEVPNTISVNVSDVDESINVVNDLSADTNYIRGIIKTNNRLIILVDILKVVENETSASIKKSAIPS